MTAEAPFRLVILKQRFPALSGKTIVRSIVKCTILTIIDSDAENGGGMLSHWLFIVVA